MQVKYVSSWDENLDDLPACMLKIDTYVFLLKFIKPIAQYNYAHTYCFINTARADTRGHKVTWQDK